MTTEDSGNNRIKFTNEVSLEIRSSEFAFFDRPNKTNSDSKRACLFFCRLVVRLLHEENVAQRILNRRIRSGGSRCDTHNDFLAQVGYELFSYNLAVHRSVCNGVVGTDATGLVDVEGSDTSLFRNF